MDQEPIPQRYLELPKWVSRVPSLDPLSGFDI
jgi:hypothetical protein